MLAALVLAAATSTGVLARCNNTVATKLEDQVRAYDGRRVSEGDINDRYVALQLIMTSADQEAMVLRSICPETAFAPIQSQLDAVQAWALLLESDLNRSNYAKRCAAAEKPVAQAFLGNAWLLLVRGGQTGSTTIYPSVAAVTAKLKPRAADVELVLPPPEDTSAYWLSQLQQKATEAITACPQ